MKRILLIDTMHPIFSERLHAEGFEVHDATQWNREKILSEINQSIGIALRSRIIIDKHFIDASPRLKFIARAGAGMESIDVPYASDKNILCINSPEGNRDAVAEHAMGLLLNLMNHISKADQEVRAGQWLREENRGTELGGKTVGLIGYGNTGKAFAQRLSGFNVTVLAYDKLKSGFSDDFVEEASMEQIYAECDVLSLHIPLNNETRFMVDSLFLNRFKKNIYFLNTSRGMIVKTTDLLKIIESGKIIGAGLDVNEYEDTSFEKSALADSTSELFKSMQALLSNKKVLLTPHIAGWTHESNQKIAEILAEKIILAFS